MYLRLKEYDYFFIVLVIGFMTTLSFYHISSKYNQSLEEARFKTLANDYFFSIENNLEHSLSALKIVNYFLQSSEYIDQNKFNHFTDLLLEQYPEIQALEWIPVKSMNDDSLYTALNNYNGLTKLSLYEQLSNKPPINSIQPLNSHKTSITHNIEFHELFTQAFKYIVPQDKLVLTPPISLMKSDVTEQAVIALHPFYRGHQQAHNLMGYVMLIMDMKKFSHPFFTPSFHQHIKLAITDKFTDQWLAGDKGVINPSKNQHLIQSQFNVGGRNWQLSASAPYHFLTSSDTNNKTLILVIGLLITLLLAFYIHRLKKNNFNSAKKIKLQSLRLQESEACYKAVLDTVVDAIIGIDESGTVSHFNQGAANLFGYQPEHIIGRNVSMLMTKEQAVKHQAYITNYLKTKGQTKVCNTREVLGRHKDGHLIPVHLSISDTGLQDGLRFIDIIRDLTSIKSTEKKLRQHQDHLNKVVHKRTVALKKANNRLKKLSEIDPLTQIPNRRIYEIRLEKEINYANRTKQPLALMILDIDYFKAYNDHYGHEAGDIVLKLIATAISETLPRKTDMVARYGGEEFVVLMPATNSEGALIVAEHIRKNIEALKIKHDYSYIDNIMTLSIGLCALQGEKISHINLFNQADGALYEAKHKGRNQCKIFDGSVQKSELFH